MNAFVKLFNRLLRAAAAAFAVIDSWPTKFLAVIRVQKINFQFSANLKEFLKLVANDD